MRPRAVKVEPIKNYVLKVTFNNGEIKKFDVKPYMKHKAFEELKSVTMFNTVKISGLSVVWANGSDICPDELYYNSI